MGVKERLSAFGHTFGVRVDGAAPRGFLRFLSLTAFQAEDCGGGFAFGHACGLRVDGASPRRFLRFLSLTAFQAEGCGIALRAMSIKSALRDNLAVSYGMIGILQVGSLRSPPPIRLRRTSPYSGGRIKDLEASLRKRQCTLHRQGKDSSLHSYCPTACGGKVVRSTKRGEPQVSEGWQV